MGTEAERQDTRKAMAFDLARIYRSFFQTEDEYKEFLKILEDYVETANQK